MLTCLPGVADPPSVVRRPAEVAAAGSPLLRQLVRFGAVGVVGTLAYLAVFEVLRAHLTGQAAGAVARVLVAVPTTWLNGRYTFGSRVSGLRLHLGALALLAVGMGTTSGALLLLAAVVPAPSRTVELLAVTLANLLAAGVRFSGMRGWMAPRRNSVPDVRGTHGSGVIARPQRPLSATRDAPHRVEAQAAELAPRQDGPHHEQPARRPAAHLP